MKLTRPEAGERPEDGETSAKQTSASILDNKTLFYGLIVGVTAFISVITTLVRTSSLRCILDIEKVFFYNQIRSKNLLFNDEYYVFYGELKLVKLIFHGIFFFFRFQK